MKTVQAVIPKYGTKIKNLPIQYRSTANWYSQVSIYNGVLSHGRIIWEVLLNPRQLPDYFVNLGFTILSDNVNSSDALFNPQKIKRQSITFVPHF
jgi:hypothetical protein